MSVALGKTYLDIIDELYKEKSLTAVLDSPETMVKMAQNGQDFLVNSITLQGPAPYSRTSGFVAGAISNAWQTVTPGYERGRKFLLDAMDEKEAHLDAVRVSSVYVKDAETPEIDAYRFNVYASTANILTVDTPAALTTGQAVLTALGVAQNAMDEQEVSKENRFLFITPTLLRLARGVASTGTDIAVLDEFAQVIAVPQTRFYKGVTFKDGVTEGQQNGGYAKTDSTGRDLNFMIVQKDAVIQALKHKVAEIIEPKFNNDADGYILKFRAYGVADIYDKKVKGVYTHVKNS